MSLSDPVAVYNAANNIEAQHVRNLLVDAGVEAYVTEDLSVVGIGWLGPLAEIHKPQVWADRADLERTKPILEHHERREADLGSSDTQNEPDAGPAIEVVCERCGQRISYPAAQRG